MIPELNGKLDGIAMRVPTSVVSVLDLIVEVEKSTMLKEVKSSIAELVVAASEKIIKTKLDNKADQNLVDDAIKEMS